MLPHKLKHICRNNNLLNWRKAALNSHEVSSHVPRSIRIEFKRNWIFAFEETSVTCSLQKYETMISHFAIWRLYETKFLFIISPKAHSVKFQCSEWFSLFFEGCSVMRTKVKHYACEHLIYTLYHTSHPFLAATISAVFRHQRAASNRFRTQFNQFI